MKILLDMNLSPAWGDVLESAGFETQHWSRIGSPNAPDTEIMEWARKNQFTVFTHDLDFGSLLFSTNATSPSVIQLRMDDIRPQSVGKIVIKALNETEDAIHQGALITMTPEKATFDFFHFNNRKCSWRKLIPKHTSSNG